MKLTPVGVDLSKSVFQLSIADETHSAIARRRLSRAQFLRWLATNKPAHLVMEACGTSHYWGRTARELGHQVTLLHAGYVKAYVRRNKTDSADADALLQAVRDRDLKPIPIKSETQQALQSLHRVREQWKSARVARINEARALLGEFGVVIPKGVAGLKALLVEGIEHVPGLLRTTLSELVGEIGELERRLQRLDHELKAYAAHDEACQRLLQITGVGVTTATAAVARVGSIHHFPRGRSFASWLGLTAREYSSGQTRRLGRITKRGDRYLRTLLIHGARSALLNARRKASNQQPLTRMERWAITTEQRVGHNRAAVALANKMARVIWAVWTREAEFNGNDADRFAAA